MQRAPTRSIMLLAVAGFAAQAQVRVTDSLLPQIASDFHTTVGAAAMVVTAYAVAHGSIQLVIGPVGDRFGKYRTVAVMCMIGAVLVALCGMAGSLSHLMLARLATEISSLFGRNVESGRITLALSLLERMGLATVKLQHSGTGRPAEIWHAVSPE